MKKRRMVAGVLVLVMLLGLLPTVSFAAGEVDLSGLVNIASEGTVSTSTVWSPVGYTTEDHPEYLTDGNTGTEFKWVGGGIQTYINNGNGRPWVNLHFDTARSIGGVKITVEHKDPDGDNVVYHYNILGKTSGAADYQTLFTGTATKLTNGHIQLHALPSLQLFTDIKLEVTEDSTDAWFVLSELDIYGEEIVDLSTLTNIASQSTISHSGSGACDQATWTDGNDETESGFYGAVLPQTGDDAYVELDFGEDHQVGGVRLAAKADDATHWYACDILTKGGSDADWTTRASNVPIKRIAGQNVFQIAFASLADIRYVKFVLHQGGGGSWGAISELSVFAPAPDPYEGLIEVAGMSEITVPNNEDQAGKIVDGSVGTWWASNSGTWNVNIDFALPGNLAVKRVELDFEHYNGRTFDLAVSRAVNNVTSDYQQLTAKNGHSANETFVYEMDEAQRMTHVRVTLLGTNGSAWPAVAEVRIYAVDETIDLKNYDNITEYATETSGSGYKQWDFGGNQQIVGFRAALPEGAAAKVLGKMKRDTGWTTYFAELQDGDNVFNFPKGMSAVRVEMTDPAQLDDFQIFGTYTKPVTDSGSVAFEKPSHSNFNAATLYLVNDGDTSTGWQGDMYPAYVDIDLEQNYNLSEIQVFTPDAGYTEYTLYTSMDGRDFDLVASKLNSDPCAQGGDKFTVSKEARIVRVYLEYYSQAARPVLNEVRVIGTPSGTAVQTAPAVDVGDFKNTEYAAPITDADVIAEVQGIISRQVGSNYVNWFTFALADQQNGYDYFTLTDEGGKIKVTGNNGVSLATGINHYLKYFCNVHISQVGNQVDMPEAVKPINGTVHKETRFPVRYAYNYCTHSYSMSFWNEPEWRNELDWLALNGVNVVLDITGQEEVWREFLMSVEYTHEEAKDFLAGPGYYAWAYMANLTGFGGPIHDSFLTERTELGRKNQRIMRVLGMEPVLQAFSGMVPVDIDTHDPDAEIIPQGVWCSFQRPTMLKTDTDTYDEYAAKFYAAQKKVFGDAKYYATDPFHEGGNTGGMSGTTVASELLDSLLEFDSDAVWVIQSWQGNPTTALLAGLRQGTDRRDHAIVLDLYAEKTENWKTYGVDTDGDDLKEFSDTPWVFCQLNNFGGRMGLHGHLDSLQQNIPAAANTTRHMAGIGISPEGSQENPVLYDFLFETIWTDDAAQALPTIDLDQWLKDYVRRRYGAESENAEAAMQILAQTVYKDSLNRAGQGAPESVINARPALSIGSASTWGSSSIAYNKAELEKAARLLLEDYETLSQSDPYLYDLADILKQILSNSAQNLHSKMAAAYNAKNTAEFNTLSGQFLALIDMVEKVLGTRSEFTFGKWTGGAVKMAENADDFTKRLYLRNAKALVTTWGAIQQCNAGGLKDYSNRQWAGLTNDYYKARWEKWIDQAKANLANNSNAAINIDWFSWEWAYARDSKLYAKTPNGLDIQALGEEVLSKYSVLDPLGEHDVDPATMTVKTGTEHYDPSGEDDRAINVLDRDTSTIWHTEWSPSAEESTWWIAFDLGKKNTVDGLRYLPRQGNNTTGRITGYEVYVSSSETDWAGTTNTWTKVANGTWENNGEWKTASFSAVPARYVKLVATSSTHSYVSAAEIRITAPARIPMEGITVGIPAGKDGTIYTNEDSDKTLQLTATVTPDTASDKSVGWSSSAENVATVDENGLVTAAGIGTAVITATADDGSGVTGDYTVTVKAKLKGSVAISVPGGGLKNGNRLTANTDGITPAAAGAYLTYQWYRGESAISGATDKTYTLGDSDVGKTVKVTVSATAASGYEGSVTSSPTAAVGKKDGPAAPTGLVGTDCTSGNNGEISGLAAGTAYEISSDGTSWTDATVTEGKITGLAAGTYYIRVKVANETVQEVGESSDGITILAEGASAYAVTVGTVTNGTITVSKTKAGEDEQITVTVRPAAGYQLVSGSLKVYKTGDENTTVTVTDNRFTMPGYPVTVTARFEAKTYTITHDLGENVFCDLGDGAHTITHATTLKITLSVPEGYELPESVTVVEEGNAEWYGYQYDDQTGELIIDGADVVNNLTVSCEDAVRKVLPIYDRLGARLQCNLSADEHKVEYGADKVILLSVRAEHTANYRMPATVTITMDGQPMTLDPAEGESGYTYAVSQDGLSATLTLKKVTAAVSATASGVPITSAVSKSALQAAYDAAKDITNEGYTETSWAAFESARNEALAVLNNADATQETVDAAVAALANAQKGLKKPSTSSAPVEVIPPFSETKPNEDGGSTTTEIRPDGTQVETTVRPDGTTEVVEVKVDGTVTETTTQPDGAKVEKVTDPAENVTVTATDAEGEVLAQMSIPAVMPEKEVCFEDVPDGHWADKAIHQLAAIEVVNGVTDTLFSPVAPMKRGDLATVLYRLSNKPASGELAFEDVPESKYYAEGIAWAAKVGVVEGFTEEEFQPETVITREQLAVMLARYAKLLGIKTGGDKSALSAFADGGKTSAWAVDGVAWCVKAGIIQGRGENTLAPASNVTRAEVAVMIDRFLTLMK